MSQANYTLAVAVLALFGLIGCSQEQVEDSSESGASNTQQPASIGQISDKRIINAESEPGNWLSHGRDFGEQRFSPLTQINTETVSQLGLEFEVDLKSNGAMEATPIMVDGTLFFSAPYSVTYAVNAVFAPGVLWSDQQRRRGL